MALQAAAAGSTCAVFCPARSSADRCSRLRPSAQLSQGTSSERSYGGQQLARYEDLRQAGVATREEIQGAGLLAPQTISISKGLTFTLPLIPTASTFSLQRMCEGILHH
jgi:hypothetical protein